MAMDCDALLPTVRLRLNAAPLFKLVADVVLQGMEADLQLAGEG
jgi:hypothetical protein